MSEIYALTRALNNQSVSLGHLGHDGLHINKDGQMRLAVNYIKLYNNLKELGILSIRELIRYDKIKYCSSPSYLQELCNTIAEVHEKPLKNSEIDFQCKQMSTDGGQRSFSFIGAHVWNALSKCQKTETSLQSFKAFLNEMGSFI